MSFTSSQLDLLLGQRLLAGFKDVMQCVLFLDPLLTARNT